MSLIRVQQVELLLVKFFAHVLPHLLISLLLFQVRLQALLHLLDHALGELSFIPVSGQRLDDFPGNPGGRRVVHHRK